MADNKAGRDKQAHDEEKRQRERDITAELERMDEPEPPVAPATLADVETALDALSFPATSAEVVEAVGEHDVETSEGSYALEELLPDTEVETFESPTAVRERVQHPTIAGAMRQIVEASSSLQNPDFGTSQRDTYQKSFRELQAIDALDDDEGIKTLTDWIIDSIRDDEKLPSSRAVRREAANVCRAAGHEVRNDDWLGI